MPQLALVQARPHELPLLFVIAMIVNVGMWLERFVIVVTSLHRDFLPSSWGMYHGTIWDWTTYPRHDRPVPALLFLFIRFAADDLDLRDADAGARGRRSTSTGRTEDAMAHHETHAAVYGLMAEFTTPTRSCAAARRAREAGYTKMDAYTPYPDRGAGRGAAAAAQPRAAGRADRRAARPALRATSASTGRR